MENVVFAGIVTFNPDIERLKENIEAIILQTEIIVLFDNGSKNQNEIVELIENYENVTILKSSENCGIAYALNMLMKWGEANNYKWMLSLDQDSVCNKDYIENMSKYFDVEPNLGIVAPIIVDRNIGVVGHNPKEKYSYVNTCITSGAFANIDAWRKIGQYDEAMFIDSVDFEFCYRMRKNNYGVIQVSNIYLLHELGDSKLRNFLFWKIRVNGHSAFRKYYIAKNNIYYPLKHHLWFHLCRGIIRDFNMGLIIILYEENKKDKLISLIKGIRDAFGTLR